MSRFIDYIRNFRERIRFNLILILSASLLLVLAGVVQYFYTKSLLEKEEERVTRRQLTSHIEMIVNTLENVESAMRNNAWAIRESLENPDSLFGATRRILEANPTIDGACIAVVPDYYPQKGRLFETYAHRDGDGIVVEQIAGPDHDYTGIPGFYRAVEERIDFWGDPYEYGENPVRELATYSYPIIDKEGRVAAVCGLDIDLSWLSDTLNAHNYYPSSFGFMLTGNKELVGEPREDKVSKETLNHVIDLMDDNTLDPAAKGFNRIFVLEFQDPVTGEEGLVNYKPMNRDPGWTVATASYWNEVLYPVRKMMFRLLLMALAGLLILGFIIHRFFRNERRLREAGIRQAGLESELRIAGRIQEEMLPKSFSERKDLRISGLLTPAKEVGGDLFDYFVRDGKLFFCIGDVSGKSVPAAIVMAVTQSLFRMVADREDDPAGIVRSLNREFFRKNESSMFVTFFLGILDLSDGTLRYCNAGHDHPVLVGEKEELLPALANLPIGTIDNYTYTAQETTLDKGSLLFLYTDGITEAKDPHRQMYSRRRLLETLSDAPRNPEEMIRCVEESVRRFADGAEQSDDITMLAFRYDGPSDNTVVDETLTLTNDISQITRLSGFVKGITDRLGLEDRQEKSMRLALEEIVVNVINYAYPPGTGGTVTIRSRSDGKVCRFTVTDQGAPFDPAAVPPADTTLPVEERAVGGLGIHLARTLMDEIRYERSGENNILTLEKNL